MTTPEAKRDETTAAIIQAGGVVVGADPLATADNPHVVVAYRIRAGASDSATLARVHAVQEATERGDTVGLIPWAPEPDEGGEEA